MADQVVSYTGAANAVTGTQAQRREIHMELYTGETMVAFERMSVTRSRVFRKTVSSGKSHQFNEMWKNTGRIHTPGTEIDGNEILHGKKSIAIDDLLIAPVFVDVVDDAIAEDDVRGKYAFENGAALAEIYDKNNLRVLYQAATVDQSGNELIVDPQKNGEVINGGATITTDRAVLSAALYSAAEGLDTRDGPNRNDRFVYLRPAEYWLLVTLGTDLVTEINRDVGGQGSMQEGIIRRLAGMDIVMSNNWRDLAGVNETVTAPAEVPVKYRNDMTNAIALGGTPDATGVVELLDIQSEAEYSAYRQGWLLLAKMLTGHGALRRESAFLVTNLP